MICQYPELLRGQKGQKIDRELVCGVGDGVRAMEPEPSLRVISCSSSLWAPKDVQPDGGRGECLRRRVALAGQHPAQWGPLLWGQSHRINVGSHRCTLLLQVSGPGSSSFSPVAGTRQSLCTTVQHHSQHWHQANNYSPPPPQALVSSTHCLPVFL